MNQHIRPPPPDILDCADPEELRQAIDRVSYLRARIVRVGLFGTLLFRADPSGVQNAQDRARHEEVLRGEVDLICNVIGAMNTGTDLVDTNNDVTRWMHVIAIREPERLQQLTHVADLSRAVVKALDRDPEHLGAAIALHMRTARNGFADLVTELCDAFWHWIAEHQATALEKATLAASTLASRLTRLEHIGAHVRLVSLNASVEAARAGEVGKGLMVIAQEFKELAEEIQTLASEAQEDIDTIS